MHSNMTRSTPNLKSIRIIVSGILLVGVLATGMSEKKRTVTVTGEKPLRPLTPTISPNIPPDVEIPPGTGFPIDFFDDYSWKIFIALVWPAKDGQRGVADATKQLADAGPRVFESYKADWELFHPDGSSPDPNWDAFKDPLPCSIASPMTFSDLALVATSKFGNLGQAGFGTLTGPIVAQNQTYVRYLTGFNKVEFDKIMAGSLFLQSNLNNVVFPNGAIDVKSSWVEMKNIAHPERFYTRQAWVFDPATNACSQETVGLVGLHIVQKTDTRPQWIWSSFEQADNISQPGAQQPFTFTNADGTPIPPNNPIAFPPPAAPPAPFNITRIHDIHANTKATNQSYQAAIRASGNSVWQFYQLVVTQWPIPISDPTKDGSPANTFPGTAGASSSYANVTMETFDQDPIRKGCMNCHNFTRANTDFLWTLKVNAFPSILTQTQQQMRLHNLRAPTESLIKDKSIIKLQQLLQSSHH
jgi:hypothetical protein